MVVVRRGRVRPGKAVTAAVALLVGVFAFSLAIDSPVMAAVSPPAPGPGISISVATGAAGTVVDVSVHDCSGPSVVFTDRGISDKVPGKATNQPASPSTAQGDFTGHYKVPANAATGAALFTAGCVSAVQGGSYGAAFQVTSSGSGSTSNAMMAPMAAAGISPSNYVGMASAPDGSGYWVAAASGSVVPFNAPSYGSAGGLNLSAPIVGIVSTPDGKGYWLVGADGGVFNFGDAGFYGSAGNLQLTAPVVGITPTPDGKGYWLVGADGGVFNYGDAVFEGTCTPNCGTPITAISADNAATGNNGYWLTGQNGGVFTENAAFYGSAYPKNINNDTAIGGTKDGGGYWLAGTDGGVFNYGDAGFYGSKGGQYLAQPVDGLSADLATGGYWLVAHDGGIFSFNAVFHGSVPGGIYPGAPTSVTARAGTGSATVNWTPPSFTGNSPLTGYEVLASPGGESVTAGGNASSAQVTGLTNGTSYTFTVYASNANGYGPASTPSSSVTPYQASSPPAQPSDTSISRTNAGSLTVNWSLGADGPNQGAEDSFQVNLYLCGNSGANYNSTVDVSYTGSASTSYTWNGLTASQCYSVTVTPHNAAGYGPAASALGPTWSLAPNGYADATTTAITVTTNYPANPDPTAYDPEVAPAPPSTSPQSIADGGDGTVYEVSSYAAFLYPYGQSWPTGQPVSCQTIQISNGGSATWTFDGTHGTGPNCGAGSFTMNPNQLYSLELFPVSNTAMSWTDPVSNGVAPPGYGAPETLLVAPPGVPLTLEAVNSSGATTAIAGATPDAYESGGDVPCPAGTTNYSGSSAPYSCLAVYLDQTGHQVGLRQGRSNSGASPSVGGPFGLLHTQIDHNLDQEDDAQIIHIPAGPKDSNGTRYEYQVDVGYNGQVVQEIHLIEERAPSYKSTAPDRDSLGVLTAYCNNRPGSADQDMCSEEDTRLLHQSAGN